MSPDGARAKLVVELFGRALGLDPDERSALLDSLHERDAELAAELRSLLAAHDADPDDLAILAGRVLPLAIERVTRSMAEKSIDPPQTIGRYHILERLGSGGMAEVYRARDLSLDRLVALKVLSSHLARDADARARLMREARAVSALDHPNIAIVFEVGTTASPEDPSSSSRMSSRWRTTTARPSSRRSRGEVSRSRGRWTTRYRRRMAWPRRTRRASSIATSSRRT